MWADLTMKYFKKINKVESSLGELSSDDFKLYNNVGLRRRLEHKAIRYILQLLSTQGRIEFKDQQQESFFIYFQSPHEIANLVYDWARSNAFIGKIQTLQWIATGDDTPKTHKLYNLPLELLLKAGYILENEGRAQVIQIDIDYGLKFLQGMQSDTHIQVIRCAWGNRGSVRERERERERE
eukprot:TRINITY_DN1212_c0_g1_i6.p4 TRINITY_DN1212_c0_g1~~TRINITY_DN1212_c0_g1_i6.p4  ORF type:complete len:181 (+),score=41.75 TRINITY_DN1212_c0_g1_i6:190-732(+)